MLPATVRIVNERIVFLSRVTGSLVSCQMSGFTPPFWITAAGSFASSWQIVSVWCRHFEFLFLLNKAEGERKSAEDTCRVVIYRGGKPEKREAVPIFPKFRDARSW